MILLTRLTIKRLGNRMESPPYPTILGTSTHYPTENAKDNAGDTYLCPMKTFPKVLLSTTLAAAVLSLPAGAQDEPPPTDDPFAAPQVMPPERQLDAHLTEAQRLFKAGNLARSGGQLFEAAAVTESLGDPTRKDLSEAVAALRLLAYDTASHGVSGTTLFHSTAAGAHQALAAEAERQASGAWDERRAETAGRALGAATYHLRRAIVWGGHSTSPEGTETLASAESIARQLAGGGSVNPGTASQAIVRLGTMITATGRTLEADRGDTRFYDRVEEASETAIDGIENGTRKAAQSFGERLKRWGKKLQSSAQ